MGHFPALPLLSHWRHHIITLTDQETWFPPPAIVKRSPGRLQVSIAHWLLILLFFIPWSAFLLWRWRRMKRMVVPAES